MPNASASISVWGPRLQLGRQLLQDVPRLPARQTLGQRLLRLSLGSPRPGRIPKSRQYLLAR
jgi:hypothetical protein